MPRVPLTPHGKEVPALRSPQKILSHLGLAEESVREIQKITALPEVIDDDPMEALTHLQRARANARRRDTSQTRQTYEHSCIYR